MRHNQYWSNVAPRCLSPRGRMKVKGPATNFGGRFGVTDWSRSGFGGRQIASCELDPVRADSIRG
jgi:hypothetical protein